MVGDEDGEAVRWRNEEAPAQDHVSVGVAVAGRSEVRVVAFRGAQAHHLDQLRRVR